MTTSTRFRTFAGCTHTVSIMLALGAGGSLGGCAQSVDVAAEGDPAVGVSSSALSLAERLAANKPAVTDFRPGMHQDELIVKLAEGSRVRLAGGHLQLNPARVTAKHLGLLRRSGLDVARAQSELGVVDRLLTSDASIATERLFTRSESDLDSEQETLEAASGEELADLNLYYRVHVPAARAQTLVDALNKSPLVEIAYPAPIPVSTAADIAPVTPSYVSGQSYLNAPPYGIDARFAWTRPGADGFGKKMIDVEGAWQYTHEDLNPAFVKLGTNLTAQSWLDHGTAVLGEIVGAKNSYGVTGIANAATFGTSSAKVSVADGVNAAVPQLGSGDVILIEVAYGGPASGLTCDTSCMACPPTTGNQWETIPVEYFQPEFDAIKAATAAGKIVVEAAANGGMNLDSAVYGGNFNPAVRDSGAIIVGAGISSSRQPWCWSDAGARVNVQAWGDSIQTLGYSAVVPGAPTNDQNQWYTTGFGGTSGASPMVVSAALSVQGRRLSLGQAQLTPSALRTLLVNGGVPQPTPVTRKVGPRIDLRCTLEPVQPTAQAKIGGARQSTAVTVTMGRACDGSFYSRQVGSNGVWGAATAIAGSSGVAPRDAAITLAPWGSNRLAAFFVGTDGAVKYFYEQSDGAWQGPFAISATNLAPPGSRVAAGVHPGGAQLDVFVVRNDGTLGVYWSLNQATPFSGPLLIGGANLAPAGAAIATLPRTNQLDVFVVGNDGAIKLTSVVGSLGIFSAPSNVSATGLFPSGAPLATGMQGTNQFDVFGVGWDGAVKAYAALGGLGYAGPFVLTPTSAAATNTEISAAVWPTNQLNVVYASPQGALNWLKVIGTGTWSSPALITGNDFAYSNASIALATEGSTKLDLFIVANQGIARSSITSGAGPWAGFTNM